MLSKGRSSLRKEVFQLSDIYFETAYGQLYEKIENGKCEVFHYIGEEGEVRHLYIKKEIPYRLEGEVYYDLVTPYGYGGPLIIRVKEAGKARLVEAFQRAFQEHCLEQNIICEFVRFHPILMNAEDFCDCYELTLQRYTTGTNLRDFENPIQAEFSKSKQKSIQKALNAGVEYRITQNPASLKGFKDIYERTMNRKEADAIYYFDNGYFDQLLRNLGQYILLVEVFYEGRVIGMSLNFAYGKLIHIHLSGTYFEYRHLSPAFVMRYALVLWGKGQGCEMIHEGGGKGRGLDDPLYLLKKQFGKNTDFNYYVSHKIWNPEIYSRLCHMQRVGETVQAFPAYRYAHTIS